MVTYWVSDQSNFGILSFKAKNFLSAQLQNTNLVILIWRLVAVENLWKLLKCMFLVAAQVLRSHSSHSDSIQALLLPMHLIIKSVTPSSASLLHHRKAAIELPGFGLKCMTKRDMWYLVLLETCNWPVWLVIGLQELYLIVSVNWVK